MLKRKLSYGADGVSAMDQLRLERMQHMFLYYAAFRLKLPAPDPT